MEMVTKRELNQHTAQVLDKVTRDSDVVITERGEPRWRVSTYQDDLTGIARLEREGLLLPAASDRPVPWPARPAGPVYTEAEVDVLLDEMKGEL